MKISLKMPEIKDYDVARGATITYDRKALTVKKPKSVVAKQSISLKSPQALKPEKKKLPFIEKESIYKRISDADNHIMPGPRTRFKVLNEIGEGATAKVMAYHDHNTKRDVAVKVLKEDAEYIDILSFTNEAHITSSLEHPNIIPVYDLDADANGNICIIMKKVSGHSLKEYIQIRTVDDKGGTEIVEDYDDLVRIILKVCDALSYAHSQGRLHQDVKPENIMVGDFGEVFLIDWGSATVDDDYVTLSPPYMSPQQANGNEPHVTDDVYCLGASLFHLLILRYPTQSKDVDELWKKKQAGLLDLPTEDEVKDVPPQLMAIAMKAIETEVKKRYQSIEQLANDLKRYQAGHTISAYKDTFGQFVIRWYGHQRQKLWNVASILLLVLVFLAILYHYKLKEIATWGRPVYTENFDNRQRWNDDWLICNGKFKVVRGALQTAQNQSNAFCAIYKQKLYGPVAIEFDGEMLPASPPGDLSFVWIYSVDKIANQNTCKAAQDRVYFQTGGHDNTFCAIQQHQQNQRPTTLDFLSYKLKPGRTYKIRGEIDGRLLSLFVDGRKVCQYRGLFPFSSGYIGLYLYYPGKVIDNIKIYSKGVAEKVSVIAIGDNYYEQKEYGNAIKQYQKIIASHPGKGLAHEAEYKIGLCYLKLAEKMQRQQQAEAAAAYKKKAFDQFRKLRNTPLWNLARLHLIDEQFDLGHYDAVLDMMKRYYKTETSGQKRNMEAMWSRQLSFLFQHNKIKTLDRFLNLKFQLFRNSTVSDFLICDLLNEMRRYDDVLTYFPQQRSRCAYALLCLGRFDELEKNYADVKWFYHDALLMQGRYDQVMKTGSYDFELLTRALLQMGKPEEVLKRFKGKKELQAMAYLVMGKNGKIIENSETMDENHVAALIGEGHFDEVSRNAKDPASIGKAYLYQQKYDKILTEPGMMNLRCAAEALLRMGKYDDVRKNFYFRLPPGYIEYLEGLKRLQPGKAEPLQKAHKVLKDYQLSIDEQGMVITHYLIVPLLLNFTGSDRALWPKMYQKINEQFSQHYYQRLWYMANFVMGQVDQKQFMKQPYRRFIDADLCLVKALRNDYYGHKSDALRYYRQYRQMPLHRKEWSPQIDLFVAKRIMQLSQ